MADQIDKIVDVVITRQTSTPTMASFSEHLVVDNFENDLFDINHRVRSFGSLNEIVEAGFSSDSYVYRAAQAQYSQSPHIKNIYVGWKNADENWTESLNAIRSENNEWYAVSVSTRRIEEQKLVATWIQSNEKLCILASGDSAIVNEVEGDIGSWIKEQGIDRVAVMYHPDCDDTKVTYYTVYSEDGINFFKDAELEEPAVIPEGVNPQLVEGEEYSYSLTTYELNENDPIPEACWFGKMLIKQPGSATWALKTLQSIKVYDLGGAQVTKCRNKNVNTYLSASGISITQEGKTGGEYIDVIHGCDWLKARIQNLVFGVLVNNDKVPYTDTGIQMIVSPLKQALDEAVKYDILASYEVEYPAVADISNTDKGNRFLPDVKFNGVLAGAIHSTRIDGTITL